MARQNDIAWSVNKTHISPSQS